MKVAVAKVLKEEGYIEDCAVERTRRRQSHFLCELKYFKGKPVIEEIKRISRPGLRQYKGKDEIPSIKGGLGIVILSTNKGVMTEPCGTCSLVLVVN